MSDNMQVKASVSVAAVNRYTRGTSRERSVIPVIQILAIIVKLGTDMEVVIAFTTATTLEVIQINQTNSQIDE